MGGKIMASCLALALTACGGSDDAGNNSTDAMQPGNATAGETGEATAGNGTASAQRLNCNAINAARGEGMDIIGVTIGMPVEQAFQKIACSNPDLQVNLETRSDGSRYIKAEFGEEDIAVQLSGVPGQERVTEIRRKIVNEAGKEPALAGLLAQLETKYGKPLPFPYGYKAVHRKDGTLVTSDTDPLFIACPFEQVGECGTTVTIEVHKAPNNPELVRLLSMYMMNPSYTQEQNAIFKDHMKTADEQRRRKEVEEASGRDTKL